MQVLLENRSQARKVRWLTWGFVLWAAGWLFWAWDTSQTYGLTPGDGGVLRPFSERLGMALLIAVLGVLPFAGMAFYAGLYLVRIERDGDAVTLTSLGMFRPVQHVHRVDDFLPTGFYEGRVNLRQAVHAPWLTLRVAGQRIPFVVDLQAEHVECDAIEALGRGRSRSR